MSAELDQMEVPNYTREGYELTECTVCGRVLREMSVEFVMTEDGEEILVACEQYINMMRNYDDLEKNKEYVLPCKAVVTTSISLDPLNG